MKKSKKTINLSLFIFLGLLLISSILIRFKLFQLCPETELFLGEFHLGLIHEIVFTGFIVLLLINSKKNFLKSIFTFILTFQFSINILELLSLLKSSTRLNNSFIPILVSPLEVRSAKLLFAFLLFLVASYSYFKKSWQNFRSSEVKNNFDFPIIILGILLLITIYFPENKMVEQEQQWNKYYSLKKYSLLYSPRRSSLMRLAVKQIDLQGLRPFNAFMNSPFYKAYLQKANNYINPLPAPSYKIWSHKGLKSHGNNTIKGIIGALEAGFKGIEIDVWYIPRFNRFILSHDYPEFDSKKKLATLENLLKVLSLANYQKVYLWLDLKNRSDLNISLITKRLKTLEKIAQPNLNIFIEHPDPFFLNKLNLSKMKKVFSMAYGCSVLTLPIEIFKSLFILSGADMVSCRWELISTDLLREIKEIPIAIYTLNEKTKIKNLRKLKQIFAILTDLETPVEKQ